MFHTDNARWRANTFLHRPYLIQSCLLFFEMLQIHIHMLLTQFYPDTTDRRLSLQHSDSYWKHFYIYIYTNIQKKNYYVFERISAGCMHLIKNIFRISNNYILYIYMKSSFPKRDKRQIKKKRVRHAILLCTEPIHCSINVSCQIAIFPCLKCTSLSWPHKEAL